MRKAILWATTWTLFASGNVFLLLKHKDHEWDSVAFAVAVSYLAIASWQEAIALRRRAHRSSAGPPAA